MFKITHKDKDTNARCGKLTTAHGVVETPLFMPVGTQGSVKALSVKSLKDCQVQMILSNAYHLYLRPGTEVIKNAGGLHKFMGWNGPLLTDSGGYQVFSLSALTKITQEGVHFQSHIDGSGHFLTPEGTIDLQRALGSDIMMPLDECVKYPCKHSCAKLAMERTLDWANRSKAEHTKVPNSKQQLLFGIVQGSTYQDLRRECSEKLIDLDFDGYAIGGVSVGELGSLITDVVKFTATLLPEERPRY